VDGDLLTVLQGQLAQRREQAQLVQGGRPQGVDQPANIHDGGLGPLGKVRKQ
jgi:hypothetical protein